VLVGLGPGSYTGLRVGVMSAKTFAYATGCALLGLETFAIIASQAPISAGRLAVFADAQQDKVYVQEFERGQALTTLGIQRMQDWLANATEPEFVSGPGLRKWAAHLPQALKPLDPELWSPHPQSVLKLALARFARGERDDVWAVEPIYLRPSAAEEQWAKRAT
jgi:tRNA threonylcarbamoyladenosine biosynthesis protein TsaB